MGRVEVELHPHENSVLPETHGRISLGLPPERHDSAESYKAGLAHVAIITDFAYHSVST